MCDQSDSDDLNCDGVAGRRQFLKKAGMFAVATPPAITLLSSAAAVQAQPGRQVTPTMDTGTAAETASPAIAVRAIAGAESQR